MTKIDDGGPAFPVSKDVQYPQLNGLTMRDWFAGQALAESTRDIWASHKYEDVAGRAYGIADAMLAERSKDGGSDA